MTSDISAADIQKLLEAFHPYYEVSPYYVVVDQHPIDGPRIEKKVQAGFDVGIYGSLRSQQLPLFKSQSAHTFVDYLESAAREIESKAGNHCTVEIIPWAQSLTFDSQQLRPQGRLQIRIAHTRGLGHPQEPSEELALNEVRELLHQLGVRRR